LKIQNPGPSLKYRSNFAYFSCSSPKSLSRFKFRVLSLRVYLKRLAVPYTASKPAASEIQSNFKLLWTRTKAFTFIYNATEPDRLDADGYQVWLVGRLRRSLLIGWKRPRMTGDWSFNEDRRRKRLIRRTNKFESCTGCLSIWHTQAWFPTLRPQTVCNAWY
jgi:hypothetical protein